jgi:hypothetical protein
MSTRGSYGPLRHAIRILDGDIMQPGRKDAPDRMKDRAQKESATPSNPPLIPKPQPSTNRVSPIFPRPPRLRAWNLRPMGPLIRATISNG